LACGVFGFYALQHRNSDVVQLTNSTPTPRESSPVSTPAVAPPENKNDNAQHLEGPTAQSTPAPKKLEKTARKDEKKQAEPDEEEPRGESDKQGHEEEPPDVPTPPNFRGPARLRRGQVEMLPGGVMIRHFPDGSQVITTPNGMRVLITKDGKRQVLTPARPNRRRATPEPTPSP